MSAEQRDPTSVTLADDRPSSTRRNPIVQSGPQRDRLGTRSVDRSEPHEPPLSVRIERTRLRLRIAALERMVARSETRRQAVIDQYERVLEDRDETTRDDSPTASPWLFVRLLRD